MFFERYEVTSFLAEISIIFNLKKGIV